MRPATSRRERVLYFETGGLAVAVFAPTLICVAQILPSLSFVYDTDTCSPTLGVPVTVVFSFQPKEVSLPVESFTVPSFVASSQLAIVPLTWGVDLWVSVATATAGSKRANVATATKAINFFIIFFLPWIGVRDFRDAPTAIGILQQRHALAPLGRCELLVLSLQSRHRGDYDSAAVRVGHIVED